MRLWPDTLVGRTVVVVLVGVVLSNIVGLAVYSGERLDVLASARGREVAERVAAAARLLEETEVRERRRVLHSLRGPGIRLWWSPRPVVDEGADDWPIRVVRRALTEELGEGASDRLRLSYRTLGEPLARRAELRDGSGPPFEGRGWHGRGLIRDGEGPRILVGTLSISDGTWLNFAAPLFLFQPFWSTRLFFIGLATMVIALAASVWAVRRASRPLATFTAAAERLGVDVNAPPLDEAGPREVRRASRAFNEMQRRLQNFIRDRTQMLAAISHDLRTPITRLRLRAEFMEDEEQHRKMLNDLGEMEAMIAATLAFARDDFSQEPHARLDLAALIQSLCADAEDGGAPVAYEGPSHVPFTGRPSALKRALANLIENAVTYGRRARVVLSPGSDAVTVTVDDDGPGIPDADLERVFEPFHRLEGSRGRETGGVGLGLAVVRSAVRAHGGDVSLSNRREGGLRARVSLPLAGTGAPGD